MPAGQWGNKTREVLAVCFGDFPETHGKSRSIPMILVVKKKLIVTNFNLKTGGEFIELKTKFEHILKEERINFPNPRTQI